MTLSGIPAVFRLKRNFLRTAVSNLSLPKVLSAFLIAVLPVAGSGCSKSSWQARYDLVQAENAVMKAYALRVKGEVVSEERLRYYRRACTYFMKAYRTRPGEFTLSRIESAAESCLRVKDQEAREIFQAFEERYVREHPTETEYGDAAPLTLE